MTKLYVPASCKYILSKGKRICYLILDINTENIKFGSYILVRPSMHNIPLKDGAY